MQSNAAAAAVAASLAGHVLINSLTPRRHSLLTTGYRVFLRSNNEDWKSHETLAAEAKVTNTHVIHGLKCGSKYQVYIMAFNEIGNSDPSESLAFTTDGGGKSIPRNS